jgi:hypothetical protein
VRVPRRNEVSGKGKSQMERWRVAGLRKNPIDASRVQLDPSFA